MSTDDGAAIYVDIANRWQQPGDITDVPKVSVNNDVNITATSSRWLTDASFLNLRNINLGYTFSQSVTKPLGISNLRMYMSAENLFFISARQGMNPLETFNGTQNVGLYPPSRIMTLGVNVNF